MGFLDLVEEHHAEGFFADRVGQFAADVVADVAGRRADQALVGMLGAELGHVEADVGALVAEQQAGDGLRQLGLADPGGPGEEGHAARAVALAAGADPGHRALDDVQHVGHRVLLALDPAADDLVGLADALAVDLQPGVFGDADLVAAHGVGDAFHGQAFHARQLDDGVEIEEQQAFGVLDEGRGGLLQGLLGDARSAEPAEQRRGQGPARRLVGLRHRDMAQARVVHQQPVGQVAFLFHHPQYAVEERFALFPGGTAAGLVESTRAWVNN